MKEAEYFMQEENNFFKICMVGPSRVGKTSLVTAILSDAEKLLAGTPISIKAMNAKTSERINQHKKELRGSLRAGEFDSGAMSGTQEAFKFDLQLLGRESNGVDFSMRLLDFPGGWMKDLTHAEMSGDRAECAAFMRSSSVLLVVVDASVIMEAASISEKRAILDILEIVEAEDLVRSWAKTRAESTDEPAMLLICPVKCESYFSDNGGSKNKSEELYDLIVNDVYAKISEIIKEEGARHAEIIYMPVDTIGCTEFVKAEWVNAGNGLTFNPHFKIRGAARENVKGADDVLVAIAKQLVGYQERIKIKEAQDKEYHASNARRKAKDDKAWYQKLATAIFDYETDAEAYARNLSLSAGAMLSEAKSVGQIFEALAAKKFGSRVKLVKSVK